MSEEKKKAVKAGRNAKKCERYRNENRRAKNKVRRIVKDSLRAFTYGIPVSTEEDEATARKIIENSPQNYRSGLRKALGYSPSN